MTQTFLNLRYLLRLLLLAGTMSGFVSASDSVPSILLRPEVKKIALEASSRNEEGRFRLRILSYNDFHGSFRERSISVGAAKLVTVLKELRRETNDDVPTAVYTISAGDHFSGTALSYYSMFDIRTDSTKPACPLEALFHCTETASACIGNHEFDWGHLPQNEGEKPFSRNEFLENHLARSLVSIDGKCLPRYSSSNLTHHATGRPPADIPSFDLISVDEGRWILAVLTFTTLETQRKTTPGLADAYVFEKPGTAALRLMELLKNEVDAFLFVAHLSSYQDKDGAVGFGRETEDMLDLVRLRPMALISAHSHRFVSGQVDGVPVVQAGSNANGVAILDFLIDPTAKTTTLQSQRVVNLLEKRDTIVPDPEMLKAVDAAQAACDFQKVGTVRTEMRENRRQLTDIGVLVTRAMATGYRDRTKGEPVLAFQHSGGIRSAFFPGDITEEDCYDMLPFHGGTALCQLPGENVIRLLREGFVNPVGYLQSFGLTFFYDENDQPREEFVSVSFRDGDRQRVIEPDRTYWVVVDSFLTTGGDGYPEDIFKGHIVVSHGPDSRDLLARYCREDLRGDIDVDDRDRLKFVVPEKSFNSVAR